MFILKTPAKDGFVLTVVSSLEEALDKVTSMDCSFFQSTAEIPRTGKDLAALVAELEASNQGVAISSLLT